MKKFLRASLKKLQVNFVDLYLIHFPAHDTSQKKGKHKDHRHLHHHHKDHNHQDDDDEERSGNMAADSPRSTKPVVVETDIIDTWRVRQNFL